MTSTDNSREWAAQAYAILKKRQEEQKQELKKQEEQKQELTKQEEQKQELKKQNLQSRLGIAQQRIKKYKERQKDFRKILGKEISELDPDEIKVKLNQIYDWNDKNKG